MIPDDIEKIIMTKDDFDRNIRQLLSDKIKAEMEVERLNIIINRAIEFIEKEDEWIKNIDYKIIKTEDLLNILRGDKEWKNIIVNQCNFIT